MKRMGGQKARILNELRKGPQPNYVFPKMGILKYTNRISELKEAGYDITCHHQKGGVFVYTLHEGEQRCLPI